MATPASSFSPSPDSFAARLRLHRERAGKTRPVLGQLVGRSADWVKALEGGKLLTPRLPMLLRLAEVLDITDLADLTGEQAVPVASVTRAGHPAVDVVAAAMQRAGLPTGDPTPADILTGRVDQAWHRWHTSHTERTAVAEVLPTLISEARASATRLDGRDRRRALAELARTWHLVQLYAAHQPRTELVWLAADRGMSAAQDADDPAAIATAAWYYGHVYRGSAQVDVAEQLLIDAGELLDPDGDREHLVLWGQLQLGRALGPTPRRAGPASPSGTGTTRPARLPPSARATSTRG